MRFVGGLNRADSRFFRYVSRGNLAALELGQYEVSVTLGGHFSILFDGPFVWTTAELEFNPQPRKVNSYVGLRRRGEDEWTWFRTRSLDELCAGLASVGATEVAAPPLQMKDLLPITLPGSALMFGVSLLLLGATQLLRTRDVAGSQMVGKDLQIVGLIALVLGVATGIIHLWGRRRSGEVR